MFRNERLGVIIPQQEHARMAGHVALHWGNENFDKPKIGVEALVKGLTLHHMGYGPNDTLDFTSLNDEELLKVYENDTQVSLGDTDAELVNLFHHLRLVRNRNEKTPTEAFLDLQKEIETTIETKLTQSKFTKADFDWTNKITHLCDRIAFNFSMGKMKEPSIGICSRVGSNDAVAVVHDVDVETITLHPWPFSVKSFKGFVIAYESKDYPHSLSPVLMEYEVKQE